MIISRFTLAEPDSDGDMRLEFEVAGENPTDHEVRLLRLTSCFSAPDGSMFSEHTSDEELRIETGEEYSIKVGHNWLKAVYFGGAPQLVTARAFATMYRREMTRLGEIAIPAEPGQLCRLHKEVDSSCLASDIRVLMVREDSEDEGTSTLTFRCGVNNTSESHIEHMVLKADLVDEDDAVLESDQTALSASPGVSRIFESQIWGVRRSQLKRARLRLSLAVYVPVLRESCTAEATPE
jgi:hypothetical protein